MVSNKFLVYVCVCVGGGGLAWRNSNSPMNQNSKHINQGSLLRWNKMSTQQQDQHWNAGAKSNSWTPVNLLTLCNPVSPFYLHNQLQTFDK